MVGFCKAMCHNSNVEIQIWKEVASRIMFMAEGYVMEQNTPKEFLSKVLVNEKAVANATAFFA